MNGRCALGRPLVVACRVHPVSRVPGCAGWRAACSARCPKLPSPRAAALVTKRPQQPSLPSGPLAMGFTVQRVGRGQPAVPGQHGTACTSAAPGWRPSFSSSAKGACSRCAGEPCHCSRVLRLRRVWTCRRERGSTAAGQNLRVFGGAAVPVHAADLLGPLCCMVRAACRLPGAWMPGLEYRTALGGGAGERAPCYA